MVTTPSKEVSRPSVEEFPMNNGILSEVQASFVIKSDMVLEDDELRVTDKKNDNALLLS